LLDSPSKSGDLTAYGLRMPSLADLPELVGFFSYSREDDADSHGALSALRNRIQGELRGQLGRTAKTFRLWQDKEAIASGTLWETEIKNAVAQSVFFIPIITPTVIASPYCRIELESFLARESDLGRNDLVFPILYIDVPGLRDTERRENDPVLSLIAKRQYADWRKFRHQDVRTSEVSEAAERFCTHIRDALHKSWVSRPKHKQQEEAVTQRQAEAERKRQEAEAAPRLEEPEAQLHKDAVAQSKSLAGEEEQLQAEGTAKSAQAEAAHQKLAARAKRHSIPAGTAKARSKRRLALALGGGATAVGLLLFIVFAPGFRTSPPPSPPTNKPDESGPNATCNSTWVQFRLFSLVSHHYGIDPGVGVYPDTPEDNGAYCTQTYYYDNARKRRVGTVQYTVSGHDNVTSVSVTVTAWLD
jgi:hypothetical protein